jgi:hypothetical protein
VHWNALSKSGVKNNDESYQHIRVKYFFRLRTVL